MEGTYEGENGEIGVADGRQGARCQRTAALKPHKQLLSGHVLAYILRGLTRTVRIFLDLQDTTDSQEIMAEIPQHVWHTNRNLPI